MEAGHPFRFYKHRSVLLLRTDASVQRTLRSPRTAPLPACRRTNLEGGAYWKTWFEWPSSTPTRIREYLSRTRPLSQGRSWGGPGSTFLRGSSRQLMGPSRPNAESAAVYQLADCQTPLSPTGHCHPLRVRWPTRYSPIWKVLRVSDVVHFRAIVGSFLWHFGPSVSMFLFCCCDPLPQPYLAL